MGRRPDCPDGLFSAVDLEQTERRPVDLDRSDHDGSSNRGAAAFVPLPQQQALVPD
ncbi:MAG: hypothetical protein AVDCRST_MAG19-1618 [uncultured Thermomicrobiales bacterium]|uniref:Uncharacterized protein n=1 Tax=uncultured Thermomicrobiales bacterium TaxID=1645740 RepID=A0A6J4U7L9_9BACT|nr:MAG: hypothetical protein AVDCRST_MAG19-1618 [uncultured Thermomicrobiales bacterium]